MRQCRKNNNLRLVDVAEKMKISYQQIQKYELGVSRIPASAIYDFSKLFSKNASYFFEGFEESLRDLKVKFDDSDIISQAKKANINVLIVEDDPSDQLIIRKALEVSEYKVNFHILHDGEQAIDFLIRKNSTEIFTRPDIILLDLNIPKKNGIEVLTEAKRSNDIRDIPIIVVTNSISKKEMLSVYRLHASGYICKSFDFDVFSRQINSVIQYWAETVILPNNS